MTGLRTDVLVVGYIAALIMGRVDFTGVAKLIEDRAWFGLPAFHLPSFGDPIDVSCALQSFGDRDFFVLGIGPTATA